MLRLRQTGSLDPIFSPASRTYAQGLLHSVSFRGEARLFQKSLSSCDSTGPPGQHCLRQWYSRGTMASMGSSKGHDLAYPSVPVSYSLGHGVIEWHWEASGQTSDLRTNLLFQAARQVSTPERSSEGQCPAERGTTQQLGRAWPDLPVIAILGPAVFRAPCWLLCLCVLVGFSHLTMSCKKPANKFRGAYPISA